MATKLDQARVVWEARIRELEDLRVLGESGDLTASQARKLNGQITEAQVRLDDAERAYAVLEARQKIRPLQDSDSVPASWGAVARGELYSENVYRPDSGASFFKDMIHARDDPSAQERLVATRRKHSAG